MKRISLIAALLFGIFQLNYGQQVIKQGNGRILKSEIMKHAYENGRAVKPHESSRREKTLKTLPAPVSGLTSSCSCDIPLDGSFSYVQFDGFDFFCSGCPGYPPDYRNDDSYTATPINLPFSFCFYGTSFNQV